MSSLLLIAALTLPAVERLPLPSPTVPGLGIGIPRPGVRWCNPHNTGQIAWGGAGYSCTGDASGAGTCLDTNGNEWTEQAPCPGKSHSGG